MATDASITAYLALLLWIPLAAALFVSMRPQTACVCVLVGAVLFLPEQVGVDAPGLPPFDKHSIASLCALLGAMIMFGRRLLRFPPGRGLEAWVLLLALGAVGTVLTNRDPLTYVSTVLPALQTRDIISLVVRDVLTIGVPFYLGRALFREARDVRDLLVLLCVGALLYIIPILIELRLSPQINVWVYGYHQHYFDQAIRAGGYRPMVFMAHGLSLALFMCLATLAATTLAKAKLRIVSIPAWSIAMLLGVLLVMCKSVGALLYGLVGVPLIALGRPRTQVRIAALLAVVVLAYPLMRIGGTFPTQTLVETAAKINYERAASLEFRFDQEQGIVDKVRERLAFGWGGFNRSHVYDDMGKDRSITDGYWIILLGTRGLVGFFGSFALLLLPILGAWRRFVRIDDPTERVLVGGLALIVTFAVVDLLPNGLFHQLPYFLAGTLSGILPGKFRRVMQA